MKWKQYTLIFVIVIFSSILVYDVIAIMSGGTEASISHLLNVWSYKFPAFTFFMGFLAGHIFWRTSPTKEMIELEKKVKE